MADHPPIRRLVAGLGTSVDAVEPMPGGASTRRYFRVRLANGATGVAMHVPDGARPEEADSSSGATRAQARWPFLEVRDLLEERGVRVPRLLADRAGEGWLLVEDLGDETLDLRIRLHPDEQVALYRRAVHDLARAQGALRTLPAGSIVSSRSFDRDLLRWELDHFLEYGLAARGLGLAQADRTAVHAIFDRLAGRIADLPRGFVHRDYQSRNLMVTNGELAWIDFQDALLGPRVYDLVALLYDSYQDLSESFVAARMEDYGAAAALSGPSLDEAERELYLVAVQRKLKDAGRFVFIDREKKNPDFLPFVTPTLRKVARALDKLADADPDMARLRAALGRALPEEFRP